MYISACQSGQKNDSTLSSYDIESSDTLVTKQSNTPIILVDSLHKEDIETIKYNIIYNNNFQPTLQLKLRNNTKKSIIAFEFGIFTKSYCTPQAFRKKIILPPNKIISFNQKILDQNECSKEPIQILIGNYILSDGSELGDPGNHYLIHRNNTNK